MSKYISATEYKAKSSWCKGKGWSDPFFQEGVWYAFPPNGVIPQKIPINRWSKIANVSRKIGILFLKIFACCLLVIAFKVIVEEAIYLMRCFELDRVVHSFNVQVGATGLIEREDESRSRDNDQER